MALGELTAHVVNLVLHAVLSGLHGALQPVGASLGVCGTFLLCLVAESRQPPLLRRRFLGDFATVDAGLLCPERVGNPILGLGDQLKFMLGPAQPLGLRGVVGLLVVAVPAERIAGLLAGQFGDILAQSLMDRVYHGLAFTD